MPVYRLVQDLVFPPAELAGPEGLLAVGGDLSPARLLLAYSSGIFPWFNEQDPVLWWSPDPRCVLLPGQMHISRSLAKTLRQGRFEVSFDRAFDQVIGSCAEVRLSRGEETWITAAMLKAYGRLHRMGYAHSVECWRDGALVGGLYGVCLGRCFFGESMFSCQRDASKVAMATLAQGLVDGSFELIDCQLPNPHLTSLGAQEIPRRQFLALLRRGGVSPSTMPSPGHFPPW